MCDERTFKLNDHCDSQTVIRFKRRFGRIDIWYSYVAIRHPDRQLWYCSDGSVHSCEEFAEVLAKCTDVEELVSKTDNRCEPKSMANA